MLVLNSLFGILCCFAFHVSAIEKKTSGSEADFLTFMKSDWPSFEADVSPAGCKEVQKKQKSIWYEACIVGRRAYYIRLLDEGTPWGVIKFKQGLPVQYEGVENPEVKLLKKGKVVAIFNESAKAVQTKFSNPEAKELNKIAEGEVLNALNAFGLKP